MSEREIVKFTDPKSAPFSGRRHHDHLVPLSILALFAVLLIVLVVSIRAFTDPPTDFLSGTIVDVPSGYTLKEIGNLLAEQHVIRSAVVFSLLVTHDNKERGVEAGEYLFATPPSVWEVARRFGTVEHGIEAHKVTLPEGIARVQMAAILSRALPKFDAQIFLTETEGKEGFLFPDTYFFFSNATSGPIVRALERNYAKKTQELQRESAKGEHPWSDIVIMASIVEREATKPEDRRIVAGILWNRIAIGMRLQVDAPFMYTIDKRSDELTEDDLASDSPYNTYRFSGLPKGPIGNPGLDALSAALAPTKTKYLYYLSDAEGTIHYAKSFTEHKLNKVKYLQ